MATTRVTIPMDTDLKEQAEMLFNDMGLTMATAFTLFTKAVVRQNKIPFEITADPFYSESNMTRLRESIANLNAGKGIERELIEVND